MLRDSLPFDPQMLVATLRRVIPGVQAIYLHGSQARGGAHSGSDMDLALLLPPGADTAPDAWLEALAAATVAAGIEADLSDLRSASSELHAEVLRHGRRLWDDGSGAAETFEMHALSEYGRLRERRAALERRIRQTGRVYG